MADHKEHLVFASGGIVGISIFLFVGGWIINMIFDETFTSMAGILFAVPLITQIFCYFSARKRQRQDAQDGKNVFLVVYLYTMFLCLFTYCVLWIFYATPLKSKQIFSCFALVFILLLLWLAWIMFRATFEELSPVVERGDLNIWKPWTANWRKCLKVDVSNEQPFGLLFFFMVFLSISYLFAFAFAFHDKSRAGEPALFMRDLTIVRTQPPHKDLPKASASFEFDEGGAVLEKEQIDTDIVDSRFRLLAMLRRRNLEKLAYIAQSIVSAAEEDNRVRVVLIGHADETPTSGSAYQSNYELAEARARNVQEAIMERLLAIGNGTWMNVEWLCLSHSNEKELPPMKEVIKAAPKGISKPTHKARLGSRSEMRVVEAVVEPISHDPTPRLMQQITLDQHSRGYKALTLMDYVYFSIYTITTTGYGDIMPNTPYIKFLISLANILEVFFLVVFFNALLSVRIEGPPKNGIVGGTDEGGNGLASVSRVTGTQENRSQRPGRPFNPIV